MLPIEGMSSKLPKMAFLKTGLCKMFFFSEVYFARVTIILYFGAPHGDPNTPLHPLMTGSETYPLPSVHFNENSIVLATWNKF